LALFGVVTILLLFVSVTLHELGHSLEALRLGVRVRNITLYPMGGIAWLERIPSNPWHELRITAAGPLVTFALAGLLWILDRGLLSQEITPAAPDLLDKLVIPGWGQMIGMLASMNLTLGLFNLIPGFPLDGGRMFRAFLALRLDYAKATMIAARIGQGAAIIFGLSILLPESNLSTFGGTVRIVIAVFIWTAAQSELQHVQQQYHRGNQTAGEEMLEAISVLSPHALLKTAAEFVQHSNQFIFPVLDDSGRPQGWVTGRMVLTALTTYDLDTPISRIMSNQVECVSEHTRLQDAKDLMALNDQPAVAVVGSTGKLKGILVAEATDLPGNWNS
jgi:stage IV sporulation protein FB